jgi:hypothetical protein
MMPKAKQARRANARPKPEIPPVAYWLLREILPRLSCRPRSASGSARHLRNAGIEVLEAMRDFLDETIEWLREDQRRTPMKRIEVEDR